MGLLDKLRGMLGGNKDKIKGGIDRSADAIGSKVSPKHAAKVDNAADKAKDVVDKLD